MVEVPRSLLFLLLCNFVSRASGYQQELLSNFEDFRGGKAPLVFYGMGS